MGCPNFHKSSSVTIAGGNLVIAFDPAATGIVDEQHFCFVICQNLTSAMAALPVVLTVNGANVPLWNKFGDTMIGANLKTRFKYKGFYGTATANHVIALNTPCNKCNGCC